MPEKKQIKPEERLIVALDLPNPNVAREMVDKLGDAVFFYKIGLELFMAGGYLELLSWLQQKGKKVFVDLKFFDVPETVKKAVSVLANSGATFATVHGNQAIMQAAAESKGDHLSILAVAVLTSLDRGDLDELGFDCDVQQLVLSRARRALRCGVDGIVSSGLEAPLIRSELGDKLLVVTPGIRPVDNKPSDDQKRTVNVSQAFINGADFIVIGRPILQAEHPHVAALTVQEDIKKIFAV